MRIVRTVADLRAAVAAAPRPVGLVPTMGALHAGHLALVERAARDTAFVVVSLFVNPAQFDEQSDLAAYPRDEARDAQLAEQAGAHLLFAPPVEEVYPDGFATSVTVAGLSEPMEGAIRGASHFRGVATVVTKLFNMAGPDVAYFGQKDAQQLTVIRRLVRDLDMPVRIEAVPTVREPDGLALSSRNVRLSGPDRERAVALHRALTAAEDAIGRGERDARAIRAQALAAMDDFGVEPEYLELVSPESLEPVTTVNGRVLVAVAARIGGTRLIDNALIATTGRGAVT
ncbi:MAG TPA: pantoate--beta-alanine ligase [Solirubrobacteraceae bacterium]|jgi:pantoate--beta-alanine ligase|nr:pantoate--beta-alanine ligase [Solirubrobacteraceae bacterium]